MHAELGVRGILEVVDEVEGHAHRVDQPLDEVRRHPAEVEGGLRIRGTSVLPENVLGHGRRRLDHARRPLKAGSRRRHHAAGARGVAPGPGLLLEGQDVDPALRGGDRGGQSAAAAAHHDDVGLEVEPPGVPDETGIVRHGSP